MQEDKEFIQRLKLIVTEEPYQPHFPEQLLELFYEDEFLLPYIDLLRQRFKSPELDQLPTLEDRLLIIKNNPEIGDMIKAELGDESFSYDPPYISPEANKALNALFLATAEGTSAWDCLWEYDESKGFPMQQAFFYIVPEFIKTGSVKDEKKGVSLMYVYLAKSLVKHYLNNKVENINTKQN